MMYLKQYNASDFPVLEIWQMTNTGEVRGDVAPTVVKSNSKSCGNILKTLDQISRQIQSRQKAELHTRDAATKILKLEDDKQSTFENPMGADDVSRGMADYEKRLKDVERRGSQKVDANPVWNQANVYGHSAVNEYQSYCKKVREKSSDDDDDISGDILTKLYERENLVTNIY
jgi:hypothetical protein